MHRIGSAKGGPIFTTVGFGNGDNLLKKIQRRKRLYTWPRLDATKRRGERHRNREDFDSISERPQNHNRSQSTQDGAAVLEPAEHELVDLREISPQVQEEQGRTRVE